MNYDRSKTEVASTAILDFVQSLASQYSAKECSTALWWASQTYEDSLEPPPPPPPCDRCGRDSRDCRDFCHFADGSLTPLSDETVKNLIALEQQHASPCARCGQDPGVCRTFCRFPDGTVTPLSDENVRNLVSLELEHGGRRYEMDDEIPF